MRKYVVANSYLTYGLPSIHTHTHTHTPSLSRSSTLLSSCNCYLGSARFLSKLCPHGARSDSTRLVRELRYGVFPSRASFGSGQFRTVRQTIDVDSGMLMAVNILKRPMTSDHGKWEQSQYFSLKREKLKYSPKSPILALSTTSGLKAGARRRSRIFMGLKEGSLATLIMCQPQSEVAQSVLKQMLQALDCLAVNTTIRRDVKPEKILYTSLSNGQFQFQLGNFGLCNRTIDAQDLRRQPDIYGTRTIPKQSSRRRHPNVQNGTCGRFSSRCYGC